MQATDYTSDYGRCLQRFRYPAMLVYIQAGAANSM